MSMSQSFTKTPPSKTPKLKKFLTIATLEKPLRFLQKNFWRYSLRRLTPVLYLTAHVPVATSRTLLSQKRQDHFAAARLRKQIKLVQSVAAPAVIAKRLPISGTFTMKIASIGYCSTKITLTTSSEESCITSKMVNAWTMALWYLTTKKLKISFETNCP